MVSRLPPPGPHVGLSPVLEAVPFGQTNIRRLYKGYIGIVEKNMETTIV